MWVYQPIHPHSPSNAMPNGMVGAASRRRPNWMIKDRLIDWVHKRYFAANTDNLLGRVYIEAKANALKTVTEQPRAQ